MANIKIGLEIHGYLNTKEKLFCTCPAIRQTTKKELTPNTLICPICCGYPGAKPMLPNSEAIKKIIQISLMLNCKINTIENSKKLVWNRKHYSWPDLPKGYQNTISGAYTVPIGEKGMFENINIRECHLEEDPASWNPITGCIDYNRSGLPLIEIVTEPDFTNSEQVIYWLNQLLLTLSYIKAVDKNAGIKADVNVSTGGERVEIKNLNSIESIKKAIEYEIERQKKEKVKRETRRFDSETGKTILMRAKEQEADYKFIPDPDLPVLKLTTAEIKSIKDLLPETPKEKLEKLIKKHKIPESEAQVLYKNLDIVEFFEKVVEKISPQFALHWITIELLRILNYSKKTLEEVEIHAEHFIELLNLVKLGKITELKAKQILNEFVPKSFSPKEKLKSSAIITSEKETLEIVKKIISKNPEAGKEYKAGKKESLNFLIGEIMKLSNRRADYKLVRKLLEQQLK